METCCVIINRSDPDNPVMAVFTTQELAEAELPKYKGTWNVVLKELPLNPVIDEPPEGMRAYGCSLLRDSTIRIHPYSTYYILFVSPGVDVVVPYSVGQPVLRVFIWARDLEHANQRASKLFDEYRANKT